MDEAARAIVRKYWDDVQNQGFEVTEDLKKKIQEEYFEYVSTNWEPKSNEDKKYKEYFLRAHKIVSDEVNQNILSQNLLVEQMQKFNIS